MYVEKSKVGFGLFLIVFLSILAGVFAGCTFLSHYLFSRIVFWIALGIATVGLLFILYASLWGKYSREHRPLIELYKCFCSTDFLLFGVATVGLAIADVHNTEHAVVFGLTVGLMTMLLLCCYLFFLFGLRCNPRCEQKHDKNDFIM